MNRDEFPRELLRILPGPIARGIGSGIATALFARIALPILEWALERELPLVMVTEYVALVDKLASSCNRHHRVPVLPLAGLPRFQPQQILRVSRANAPRIIPSRAAKTSQTRTDTHSPTT